MLDVAISALKATSPREETSPTETPGARAPIDITLPLSTIGMWRPLVGDLHPYCSEYWGIVRLGADQNEGIAMTCWAFTGFDNTASDVTPIKVLLLAQQDDGTLRIATDEYLPSAVTNGGGSVNVADFNGDGRDDIFLAAHNESPFVAKPSTVYLSRLDGKFEKVTLNDAVMAHDASLEWLNGKPVVLTVGFAEPPMKNPMYTYDGKGGFRVTSPYESIVAVSVTMGDFLGDGSQYVVFSDFRYGPDFGSHPV